MNSTSKVAGISAVIALIIGFCLGYFPQHSTVEQKQQQLAQQQQQMDLLQQGKGGALNQVGQAQVLLALGNYTIEAAQISSDADQNNYSVAATGASKLFTELRTFSDGTGDPQLKQQIGEVLNTRDQTTAALAKADPAVKQLLDQIFRKLLAIRTQVQQQIG